jgi:hypothetical protein
MEQHSDIIIVQLRQAGIDVDANATPTDLLSTDVL